jgi:hypothetical protein
VTTSEAFVSRWARLKRNADIQRRIEPAGDPLWLPAADPSPCVAEATIAQPRIDAVDDPFDPSSLPSIETITGNTDIRGFLQSRVPAELTRAALRQAWASDPAIRDFIGIAENQWDFTNPTTIPGFGSLHETGDKLSLIAQTVPTLDRSLDEFSARLSDTDASAEKSRSVTGGSRRDEIGETVGEKEAASATRGVDSETSNAAPESGRVEAAVQNNLFPGSATPRRRHAHGGALPR